MSVTFGELKAGEAFVFHGRRYVKSALSMAQDERHCGHIFLPMTVVEPETNGRDTGGQAGASGVTGATDQGHE
jgi:hypothetical protein